MRWTSSIAILLSSATAVADSGDSERVYAFGERRSDQAIGAEVGLAAGGDLTPGGLRVAGHYLYQLSSRDWFDGVASFTYGGNGAGCYEDQMATTICDHGPTSGSSVEVAATVRRYFERQGAFMPFARAGLGIAIVHYGADNVSGLAFPIHAGGGVRARVAPTVSIVAQADLTLGIGAFSRSLGAETQLGMAVTAGAEFDLR